jgi:hypothetical protein
MFKELGALIRIDWATNVEGDRLNPHEIRLLASYELTGTLKGSFFANSVWQAIKGNLYTYTAWRITHHIFTHNIRFRHQNKPLS